MTDKDCECPGYKEWKVSLEKRKQELVGMKNTKSFISYDKALKSKKEYCVHDNGGRPFKVVVDKNGIRILKLIGFEDDEYIYDEKKAIRKLEKFLGYWSGFDSSPNEMHENSILIQVTKHNYIFVGENIYSFVINDQVRDYISYMGSSNVPYPIAYTDDYVIFLTDSKKISKKDLKSEPTVADSHDIIMSFWNGEPNFILKDHDRIPLTIKVIRKRDV